MRNLYLPLGGSRIRRTVLACALAALGLVTSGGEPLALAVGRPSARDGDAPRRYDGETVFRGLVFGLGPAARLIPEIWDPRVVARISTPEFRPRWIDLVNRIVTGIRTREPEFFERFGLAVQSGDPVTIDQGFRDAAGLLRQVAAEDFGARPTGADGIGRGQCAFTVVVLPAGLLLDTYSWGIAYVDVAAFYAAIVMQNAVFVVDTIFFIDNQLATGPGGSGAGGNSEDAIQALRREMWIDLIAKRFGGGPLPSVLQSLS